MYFGRGQSVKIETHSPLSVISSSSTSVRSSSTYKPTVPESHFSYKPVTTAVTVTYHIRIHILTARLYDTLSLPNQRQYGLVTSSIALACLVARPSHSNIISIA